MQTCHPQYARRRQAFLHLPRRAGEILFFCPGNSCHPKSQYRNRKEQPFKKDTGNEILHYAHRVVSVGFFDVVYVDGSPACDKISIVNDTEIVFLHNPMRKDHFQIRSTPKIYF